MTETYVYPGDSLELTVYGDPPKIETKEGDIHFIGQDAIVLYSREAPGNYSRRQRSIRSLLWEAITRFAAGKW